MAICVIKEVFQADIQKVWNIVTNLEDYAWRSDLSKIEVMSDVKFVEYSKSNYATTFTVTSCEPCKVWEFDIENDNMKGHWIGKFESKNVGTEIEFIEEITPKKFFMKPFVKSFLKKQQAQYVADLKKALLI